MVYLYLYNGVSSVEDRNDCGVDGPVLGPYEHIQITYGSHLKAYRPGLEVVDDLAVGNDGIRYGDLWYGDFMIYHLNTPSLQSYP